MTFDSHDVVSVPFPFTDQSATKRRPALVVSSRQFNNFHEQSIMAMITSSKGKWPSDVSIQDWQKASLGTPCKVRFKLFTLDNTLVLRKIGVLSARDGRAVIRALSQNLELG